MSRPPDWLTARAVAHRGLHDPRSGLVENTMPAFEAAIGRGFAIECDVQVTAEGDAVVFHDDRLDRLTGESGPVAARSVRELAAMAVRGAGDTIPSLARMLAEIDGRTPLVIEVKSRFDGDMRLADAVAGALGAYHGPAALMSFDPAVMRHLASHRTGRPLGIVATRMTRSHWPHVPAGRRMLASLLLHGPALRADFIAYDQARLPAVAPLLLCGLGRKALLSWTVRDAATARRVLRHADQIIFEGFDPLTVTDAAGGARG